EEARSLTLLNYNQCQRKPRPFPQPLPHLPEFCCLPSRSGGAKSYAFIGSGFGTSFRSGQAAGQQHYLNYFYPGTLVMIVLFTAIFTMMSVIEDRKEGFLLSVLVAPVPRAAIVLGKVLGGTTLAAAQGLICLVFAPLVG